MKELKTLKDINLHEIVEDTLVGKIAFIPGDDTIKRKLKAEAVKWVKYYERKGANLKEIDIAYFIRHFFNLTEEDLEEEE